MVRSILIPARAGNNARSASSNYRQPMVAALANAGTSMCEKCNELDAKIEHYQKLAARLLDPPMIEAINKLIEKMQAKKARLHPECK
jgi:hypothetical protein